MGANWAPSIPNPFANLDEDDAELVNLFKGFRTERHDVKGSFSSMSPSYNLTSNASPTRMFV